MKGPDGPGPSRTAPPACDALVRAGAIRAAAREARGARISARRAAAHFSAGEMSRRRGKLAASIGSYRQAVEHSPNQPYYRYRLADALLKAGDPLEGLKELEAARDLEPTNGYYHFRLGDHYARVGRVQEAMTELQQAALFCPTDPYYAVRLGAAYLRAGRTHEAATAFRQAVDMAPHNAAYHAILADAYVALGLDRRALDHYRLAGGLDDFEREYVEGVRRHATGLLDPWRAEPLALP